MSERELLEHYPDAVRQERRRVMEEQMIHLDRQGYAAEDWTWLDNQEQLRWAPEVPLPEPKNDEIIDLFERARQRRAARKAGAEDGPQPQQLSGAARQFGGRRDRTSGSPEAIRAEDLFGQQRSSGDQKGI